MPLHIAQMTIKGLNDVGKVIKGSKVLLMGLTYKENVADTRETPVKETIRELNQYGVVIYGFDPLIDDITTEFGIHSVDRLTELDGIDSTVLCIGHDTFRQTSLDALKNIMNPNPVLVDVRGFFNAEEATTSGFYYKTL
jgi:UDP-N-acetyl-D-mannosaminuronate dehydrogenase